MTPPLSSSDSEGDSEGDFKLDTLEFGLTVSLVGMAGTMLVLWLVSLLILLLKKIFPYRPETSPADKKA